MSGIFDAYKRQAISEQGMEMPSRYSQPESIDNRCHAPMLDLTKPIVPTFPDSAGLTIGDDRSGRWDWQLAAVGSSLFLITLINQLYGGSIVTELTYVFLYALETVLATIFILRAQYARALAGISMLVAYETVTNVVLEELYGVYLFKFFVGVPLMVLFTRRRKFSTFTVLCFLITVLCAYRYFFENGNNRELLVGFQYILIGIAAMSVRAIGLTQEDVLRIVRALAFSIASIVLLSLVVHFTKGWMSFSDALSSEGRFGDLTGISHNSFAYVASVGLISSYILTASYSNKALYIVVMMICGLGMVMTKSLSSILVSGTVMALIAAQDLLSMKQRNKIVAFAIAIGVAFVAFMLVETQGALGMGERNYKTLTGRTLAWAGTVDLISKSPVMGMNIDEFKKGFGSYFYVKYERKDRRQDDFPATPHNMALALVAYYGIPLGGGLVVINLLTICALFYREIADKLSIRHVSYLPIAGLITHMAVDIWYFLYWWIFVCIGISVLNSRAR